MDNNRRLCSYYIAHIERARAWLMASVMRGTEHIAFDRALDKQQSIFEFFVPQDTESVFLEVIEYLRKEGVVLSCEKRPNRLENGEDF